ncbi:hypothetical protein GW17_00003546 [Ensete ventricosum]|nr:hypothetical protein GW17_00003546 [Ensete ventricosum]
MHTTWYRYWDELGTPVWTGNLELLQSLCPPLLVGARQPTYLVTADDVDSYLAIEVHPLDDRKRKVYFYGVFGELVKVFANEQRKIPCGEPHFPIELDISL